MNLSVKILIFMVLGAIVGVLFLQFGDYQCAKDLAEAECQLIQEKSFKEAGEFACTAAAKVVTQFGPRLSKAEAQTLIK